MDSIQRWEGCPWMDEIGSCLLWVHISLNSHLSQAWRAHHLCLARPTPGASTSLFAVGCGLLGFTLPPCLISDLQKPPGDLWTSGSASSPLTSPLTGWSCIGLCCFPGKVHRKMKSHCFVGYGPPVTYSGTLHLAPDKPGI